MSGSNLTLLVSLHSVFNYLDVGFVWPYVTLCIVNIYQLWPSRILIVNPLWIFYLNLHMNEAEIMLRVLAKNVLYHQNKQCLEKKVRPIWLHGCNFEGTELTSSSMRSWWLLIYSSCHWDHPNLFRFGGGLTQTFFVAVLVYQSTHGNLIAVTMIYCMLQWSTQSYLHIRLNIICIRK